MRRIVTVVCLLLTGLSFDAAKAQGSGSSEEYIHYRLGVKFKNEGRLQEAVESFRKVLAAYPDNYNAYMHLAEIRKRENNPRLMIYNARKALVYNPGWGKAHRLLAEGYELDGQYQKAIMELQLYQQTCDPAEHDAIQSRINVLLDKMRGISTGVPPTPAGQPARPEADPAAAASPTRRGGPVSAAVSREFERAVKLYEEKQYSAALAGLRSVLASHPGHPGAYYYAGLIRYRNGERKMAKINFERALGYDKLGYNAHFYLGKIYAQDKDYNKAVEHLRLYISKTDYEEGKAEAQRIIDGFSAEGVPDADSTTQSARPPLDPLFYAPDTVAAPPAEQVYTPIEIGIDSLLAMEIVDTLTDPGRHLLRGVREFMAGRFDKAIGAFRETALKYPRGDIAAKALYNSGVCQFKMRLFSQAEQQFQQVVSRFPSHPLATQSSFLKAVCAFEKREMRDAETGLQSFLRTNRTHRWAGNAYEKLGDVYTATERHRNAADSYEQAAKNAAKPFYAVFAWYKLGMASREIDNGPRALKAFRSAIEVGEKAGVYERVPDSYYRIADYHFKQRDYRKALEQYQAVTRKYPAFQETPWGLFQIGTIHKNLKNYKEAIEVYKVLTVRYPEDYWARQARWKMEDTVWEYEYQGGVN